LTDPVTLATAGVATAVSVAIGWLTWPRAPDLDGERLFKVVLATLLRGRIEAEDGDVEAWCAAVIAEVPYHPAGRFPEHKVTGLGLVGLPALIDGEAALIEKLGALPDLESRWRWLYDEDEVGLAARLDDPIELGPQYDPKRWLSAQTGWDSLADWGAGQSEDFPHTLARQHDAIWVLVQGRTEEPVLDALEAMLPRTVRVGWSDLGTDELESALAEQMDDPRARFVLVGAEAGIQVLLRLLVGRAPLRDQTDAVLSISGVISGDPGEPGPLGEAALGEWMQAHFSHHELDTEMTRKTPYFSLEWLDRTEDPPAGRGRLLGSGRFPEPRLDSMTQEYVQIVDLGVLYEGADPERVARGLWCTVGCWVLSQPG